MVSSKLKLKTLVMGKSAMEKINLTLSDLIISDMKDNSEAAGRIFCPCTKLVFIDTHSQGEIL